MLIIKQITVKEAEKVFEIQQKAYASLLKKYQDFETNPGAETLKTVREKIELIYKDARIWKLDTILQEAGNCHLYIHESLHARHADRSHYEN